MFDFLLLSGLCVIVLTVHFLYQKRTTDIASEGVKSLSKIHGLIGNVQKHRGLNASFLMGKSNAQTSIFETRSVISRLVNELHSAPYKMIGERWNTFLSDWRELEQNSMALNTAQSFERHTSIIENLLFLLEDVAAEPCIAHYLAKTFDSSELLWRELPFAVECIGRARAVGVSVVGKGESDQVDKVRLSYLTERVSELSSVVFKQFKRSNSNAQYNLLDLTTAENKCKELVRTIESELIQKNEVTLPSDSYFNLASNAMDEMNKILKSNMSVLMKTI